MTMNCIGTVDVAGAAVRVPSYPLSILKGCASIDEVPEFRDLPDGFIRVVMRLVKKISVATPFQPIFARRETLARESNKSCETVGRAIRWLEENELITRQQKSRPGLRGSEALIRPTKKFITALGIGASPKPNAPATTARPVVISDGSVSANQVNNLKRQSEETACKSDYQKKLSTEGDFVAKKATGVRIDGKSLPAELVWMVSDGNLPATGVLRLMKIAKETGKRLSDVVAVAYQYLVKLRGRALFAYVSTLLRQDKDYRQIIKVQTETIATEHKAQQDRDLVARKSEEWQGRRFQAHDGRIFTVEAKGYLQVSTGDTGRVLGGQWIDIYFVDAVIEGKLRSAG
jgi:hypothetical protein